MIKPKLHHVTIKTSRLDEMITWYGVVIGAKVQFRDQTAAWTTNDEANHRIAFLAPPGLSDDGELEIWDVAVQETRALLEHW